MDCWQVTPSVAGTTGAHSPSFDSDSYGFNVASWVFGVGVHGWSEACSSIAIKTDVGWHRRDVDVYPKVPVMHFSLPPQCKPATLR